MNRTESDLKSQPTSHSPDRRRFLSRVGGATAATVTASILGSSSLIGGQTAEAAEVGPLKSNQRKNEAYQIRHKAALYQKNSPSPAHPTNGDEELHANHIASYSKGLPHNSLGEVDLTAYSVLLQAMSTGDPAHFDAIPKGDSVKLASPQAALAFELEGADSHQLGMPAPPAFSSEEVAGEMAELYWLALTRDVPFSQYGREPLTAAAVNNLPQFSNFRGVKAGTLFRGKTPGDLTGPYLSQFLWKDVPYGSATITQKYRTTQAGVDHMTSYSEWLYIQNGGTAEASQFDPQARYIRNGRDLAEWVHRDFTYQAFLNAALVLLSLGGPALSDTNPYKSSQNQGGFVTFGPAHVLDVVARVANSALKAAWYQKWSVHRRLRPEEFGGRVHNKKTGAASYPIQAKLLSSPALSEVFNRFGTYLLPMAYPEGCPTHPAYPAGHAAIAGACATVLKAFFKESLPLPSPVVASDDGLSLLPYGGPTLTVGGELNKLASNIALGRDTAGVHWRSDGIEGLNLGEAVAMSTLIDHKRCFNEQFAGFSFTKFDGSTVTI